MFMAFFDFSIIKYDLGAPMIYVDKNELAGIANYDLFGVKITKQFIFLKTNLINFLILFSSVFHVRESSI